MYRSKISLLTYPSLGIALAMACGPQPIDVPDEDGDSDNGGTGASQGSGGSFGGSVATGGFSGTPATGGSAGTPATGGSAGTPATGGSAGTPAMGGTPATGGTFPTGGVAGAGGAVGVGGSVAGTPATGGSAGAGMLMCGATFEVGTDGFVRAPGTTGCWNGYAYSGGDAGSMLTTPTSFGTCGMPCMLRVAGTLGPANAANLYAGVVYLGFNVNQAAGTTTPGVIAPTGTGLQVTYTKTAGPATIRVQIQTAGGASATRWCANLTASPATIPYSMFNTQCWDNLGTAYAKQPIEAIQLVAPGGEAAQAIDMTFVSVKDT
jgi:hypothetical protein